MKVAESFVALLIFPGLLYAAPMSWLMVWVERKLEARFQGRIGPPFYQPFFDFIKLLSKRVAPRPGFDGLLLSGLPLLAIGAILGALALLPVFNQAGGFAGDLILLVALLEVPALCLILAGFASRSIFGQVGATREALLSLGYNLPFLTALAALSTAADSLELGQIAGVAGSSLGTWLAMVTLAACLPVKLHLNPFSIVNAPQEIYTGPTTEFGGPQLALWEMAHHLEWVLLTGLVVSLALPFRTGVWPVDAALFSLVSLGLAAALTLLATATARIKIGQALQFYWRWIFGLSLAALAAALLAV